MPVLTKMVGFVVTTNSKKAQDFYGKTLGFRFVSDDDYALEFDAHGTMLRVTKAQKFTPQQVTVLGWQVDDIHAAIRELVERGVHFEQYNLSFMKQDKDGVWEPGNGAKVAWFKDPDGNVLSISQHPH